MRYVFDASSCRNFEFSSRREWLLPNGIGGFAMGTISGANQRRYHGLLVAAIEPPAYRMVLIPNIDFEIQGDGTPMGLSCNQYTGAVHPEGYQFLEEFAVGKHAYWRYRAAGMILEKRVAMHPGKNVVTVRFTNPGKKAYTLTARPHVSHKFYHGNFRADESYPQTLLHPSNATVIEQDGVRVDIVHVGADRKPAVGWYYRFENHRELERGLEARDDAFCPCELSWRLEPGVSAELILSTDGTMEPWTDWEDTPVSPSLADQLRTAAEKFLVKTEARTSILAGYPWFTDWGRDTMIALPGLLLHTGRLEWAKQILRDYGSQMKDGLIPNRFVEVGEEPEYNTVDATLWYAQAAYATLTTEWDEVLARELFAKLHEMFEWHLKGTHFGIHVDPEDGLLSQGQDGVQLTWMDAKIGDWVVTPRHGKPVEINGLWINACRVLEWLAAKLGETPGQYARAAERAEASFESKFWRGSLGYYLDTVDPDDASLRPNQLIAMSLPFGPAQGANAKTALGAVSRELLTPVGLRTLSTEDAAYRARFRGPMLDLDSAYHQGTVWPWLMGPYITALVRLTDDRAEARRILKNAKAMLIEAGIGGLAEVYDGDEPRGPGGCPFQAWSVAEWLRAWVEDAEGN
jgi:glycogen debranching enzyme